MAPLFLVLALIIQSSIIYADSEENETVSREILENAPEHEPFKEFRAIDTDWLDMFMLPQGDLHPHSASAKMAHVANSDKSPEEQLEEMKEVARQITMAIQSEMANLLSYALAQCEKDTEHNHMDNNLRKKRSIETPMDSSQLVMRLLKHIKSNNEYQNIAIEKMMSAQEIADKFGIDYHPDPDVFSEYAMASNKQAGELASILQDASEMMNKTMEIEFIPINDEPIVKSTENDTYHSYSVHPEDIAAHLDTPPTYEYTPEIIHEPRVPAIHEHYEPHPHYNHHYNHPHETQMVPPPHQHHRNPPVSPMPAFFEPITYTPAPFFEPFTYSPAPEFYPVYYHEPITTTTTIVLPFDEPAELEPELVGEEFEETVSSKVTVDRGDEPGSATVNHVMTYTLSEKSHFKKPEMDSLPQQMQYYFFLM